MTQRPPDITPIISSGDLSEERLRLYLRDSEIAVDTETMGLNPLRDRLCLVQICNRAGQATLVTIPNERRADVAERAPRLKTLFESKAVTKVFHYARFDLATLRQHLGILVAPIYCTRTASKLVRTYTARHGLKDLAAEFLDIELDKTVQQTDWSTSDLSPEQVAYAVSDVSFLLLLKDRLADMLAREGREALARECFAVIPTLAQLDLMGYVELFDH
ncbi:MAG: ribonuclease H-like domain-containing protein [Vicinamibacteria bacterium]|jgi:ribonuclease D|nr:ribonuclease H-like domain-containing protein [Vicinamibacteria bacterium]